MAVAARNDEAARRPSIALATPEQENQKERQNDRYENRADAPEPVGKEEKHAASPKF